MLSNRRFDEVENRVISFMERCRKSDGTKRMMKELGYSISEEEEFVKSLLGSIAGRVKAKSSVAFGQLVFLLVFTFVTILGYIFKLFKGKYKEIQR